MWEHFLELDYPAAEKVSLVCDNLNTHVPGAYYETFPPKQARSLLSRLEIHHTPKHGSWLNIAEIEFNALTCQTPEPENHDHRSAQGRNSTLESKPKSAVQKSVDWQFNTSDARRKLKQLYPMN